MDMKRILQAIDGVAVKPVEGANDMKKFLQVINEGATPHKVALPVQMAMQHYQEQPTIKVENKSSIKPSVRKFFREVETELLETAAEEKSEKEQLIKQYAQTIAERVLMKEGKAVKQRLDPKCWKGKHKEGTKVKGGVRVNNCVPNESISEHELPGHTMGFNPQGPGLQSNDPVEEMPAWLQNDPEKGHVIIPHGGMGSGKEETWKTISTRKLQEAIDLINSGNYTGAEHVLYKSGFVEGAVRALARYEEFKIKQGKRPMAKGKEVEIGESEIPAPVKPKVIKPKAKTSTCRTGQTQVGMQSKDGKMVPKCAVKQSFKK
jgi:hypothetical protein